MTWIKALPRVAFHSMHGNVQDRSGQPQPMGITAFLSAVLALLVAPGPTNTLMALAGAQRGLRGMSRLLPAELAGYLCSVLPMAFLGAELLARWPSSAEALKVAAAGWVMFLAFSLWRRPGGAQVHAEITAPRIFVTTLMNPKALIFGLVLLPSPASAQFAPHLALFCLSVSAVALLWGAGGALTRGSGNGRLPVLQRLASGWLAVVSMTLIASVLRA